jgi:cytochrome c-type biogenesis protein CcmF
LRGLFSLMSSLGTSILLLALVACAYGMASTVWAYRGGFALATDAQSLAPGALSPAQMRSRRLLASAHNATWAVWTLITVASAFLIALFLLNDFSVKYVWAHSALAQPTIYKISASWGGQAGSLLMWLWMLATYSLLIAITGRKARLAVTPTAVAILHATSAFFLALIIFSENPFAPIEAATVPADGRGLNPLLQNYWMQIHPPTLYVGYVGCAVPFALAMAALLHRRFDKDWLSFVRRWTLFPWLILTLGIIMGGAWAYETLGWGGYWAWDPVENASLMPWLTGTAFLHSIIIQARRGLLKNWNMVLVTLTFLLSVFGTFLTRSGVVSSVHSFAESDIGGHFLGFLAFALVVSFGLIVWRREELANTSEIESPLSREGAFLLNNWILLGAAFAVLWGTVFPALSEALASEKVSVGAPYFNRVMVPLGLVLLALTGVGPLMPWRQTTLRAMLKTFAWPLAMAVAAAPGLWALSRAQTGAATSFVLAAFVIAAIASEFVRGARARSNMTGEGKMEGLLNLVLKNKGRYGGYIVHLGIVTLFVGFAGNAFNIETEPIALKRGETMRVGEYTLRYTGLGRPPKGEMSQEKEDEVAAIVRIERDGKPLLDAKGKPYVLQPRIDTFKATGMDPAEARAGQEPQTARRPDIMTTFGHDLYLVLDSFDPQTQQASIKAYLNPLVVWVWISTLFFIGGTAIALIPDKRRARRASEASERTPSREERQATPRNARSSQPVAGNAAVADPQ